LILPKWTAIANYIKGILSVHILGREPNFCPMVEWTMPKKRNTSVVEEFNSIKIHKNKIISAPMRTFQPFIA